MNELTIAEQGNLTLLDTLAAQARTYAENAIANMLNLGHVLVQAKELLPHGQFVAWMENNVGISQRYGEHFMGCYERFGEKPQYMKIGKSKLIRLLALPAGTEDEFIETHDVDSMSVRDVEAEVRKVKQELRDKEAEIKRLRRDKAETEELLEQTQSLYDQVRGERHSSMSAKAREDDEAPVSVEFSLESFNAAVGEFMRSCARLPYMGSSFAVMDHEKRAAYEDVLGIVEGWCSSSREAINTYKTGGIVIE